MLTFGSLLAAVARCVPRWLRGTGVSRLSGTAAAAAAGHAANGERSLQNSRLAAIPLHFPNFETMESDRVLMDGITSLIASCGGHHLRVRFGVTLFREYRKQFWNLEHLNISVPSHQMQAFDCQCSPFELDPHNDADP